MLMLCSQFSSLLLLLDHLTVGAFLTLLVKVFNLSKVPPLCQKLFYSWWVLASAIPTAWRITDFVLWISHPLFTLLRNVEHLEKSQLVAGRFPNQLEKLWVCSCSFCTFTMHVKVVHQRLCHHL